MIKIHASLRFDNVNTYSRFAAQALFLTSLDKQRSRSSRYFENEYFIKISFLFKMLDSITRDRFSKYSFDGKYKTHM